MGHELFHEIGCVAGHPPRDEDGKELTQAGVISLAHLPGKHQAHALADFLHDPLKVRPSGRMPDMNLTEAEAAALAMYLEASSPTTGTPLPTPEQIRKGEQDFMELNCAACHSMDDYDPPAIASGPAPEFDLSQGCLPRFTLNRHPSSTCPLRPPVSPCSTASATSRCFPSRHSNPFSISSF